MNVQERALESYGLHGLLERFPEAGAGDFPRFAQTGRAQPYDAVSPFGPPPAAPQSAGFWGGMLQKIFALLSEILSAIGGVSSQAVSGQRFFSSGSGSSTGDPHLAFSGTDAAGVNASSHFDSMTDHADLLDSDSFAGGYRLSTGVTQPGQNSVTFNDNATITTQDGQTAVRLDRSGKATYALGGQSYELANGQTVDLGSGETVTRASDGTVTVTDDNGQGGRITTTLRDTGTGVDVSASAQNVDLGGDLLNGQSAAPALRIRPEELTRHAPH